jgi:hypothetical protein
MPSWTGAVLSMATAVSMSGGKRRRADSIATRRRRETSRAFEAGS